MKLSMKLLIDKKENRVLFAEASKDFVDFLFSLLSLPVGSVIKLLSKKNMVGCIANLYESVENMNDTYILQPDTNKEFLLNPKVAAASPLNVPRLTSSDVAANCYYTCSYNHHRSNITDDSNTICPHCSNQMNSPVTFIPSKTEPPPPGAHTGYVKEVVTYMIMDDLTVMPMSTISSITLLNKFNIMNVNLLEERIVDMGIEQGLELLKKSLQSKTVLSDVFLGEKATEENIGWPKIVE